MDTEYTKGFKAGMAWREAEIIKLLARLYPDVDWDLAFSKGEK